MTTNWWKAWKATPALDVEAEVRYKKRQNRLQDVLFQAACKLAKIEPSNRQARKWNNGKGIALLFRNEARKSL